MQPHWHPNFLSASCKQQCFHNTTPTSSLHTWSDEASQTGSEVSCWCKLDVNACNRFRTWHILFEMKHTSCPERVNFLMTSCQLTHPASSLIFINRLFFYVHIKLYFFSCTCCFTVMILFISNINAFLLMYCCQFVCLHYHGNTPVTRLGVKQPAVYFRKCLHVLFLKGAMSCTLGQATCYQSKDADIVMHQFPSDDIIRSVKYWSDVNLVHSFWFTPK